MSATVSFDGLASDPTSTDHFHDTSGLYSFELYRIVNIVSYVFAGVSILLSIFIIVSAYILHRNPRTRHTVNRISFRLMCLSMFAEIIYDAVYLGTYIGDSGSIGSADELTTKSVRLSDRSCSALVYFLFASMGVVNWLFTAIAVNLVLIVVYNISPKQKRLERWYIIASFTLGVGVPFVPAILGHFGQDVYYRTCYFSATEPVVRRVHFLLDIYLWQGLSCLIALFCTIMVLVSLFRTSRNTARALFLFNRQNTETPAQPQTSNAVELKDRYIRTALRISSYPIALVIINGILTAGDLFYNENGGVDDTGQAVFAAIYTWFYGGRGLILALIGIFVDPCLRNGYRARRSPAYGPPVVSSLAPPQALQDNATSAKPALTARRPPEPWRRRSSEVMELSYDPPSTGSGSQQTDSYKYPELDLEVQLHVGYPPTASVDSDEAEKLYGEVEAQL